MSRPARQGPLYVGAGPDGAIFAPAESAMLVLGPPRSGKSSAVVIPNVLAAAGPVVSASTKADVLEATVAARRRKGACLCFDPSGSVALPQGAERVGWSPVPASASWEGSLRMAAAMVGSARAARTHDGGGHWVERAEALLAPLLHAAALDECSMVEVVSWVQRHELATPREILEDGGATMAAEVLEGIAATESRERSSILSTAAGALAAYRSEATLASTKGKLLDSARLVESADMVAICAPGVAQALYAPLVVGLIEEVRAAAYARAATGKGGPALLLALDEVANIAPLAALPAIAAEGGSQGLSTLACLQDLSQARARWGEVADGFMSLFGAKLVLPGIADLRTLEAVSALSGDEETRTMSVSRGSSKGQRRRSSSLSMTAGTRRQRRLPVDAISRGIPGEALYLQGGADSRSVTMTPWHSFEPWRSLASGPRDQAKTPQVETHRRGAPWRRHERIQSGEGLER